MNEFEKERRRFDLERAKQTQVPASLNNSPYFTTDQTDLDAVLNSTVNPSFPEIKKEN